MADIKMADDKMAGNGNGNARREKLFQTVKGISSIGPMTNILDKNGKTLIARGEYFTFTDHDTIMLFKIVSGKREGAILGMTEEIFHTVKLQMIDTDYICVQIK